MSATKSEAEKDIEFNVKRAAVQQYAQVRRAYHECSDEVQAGINRMLDIIDAEDATDEERNAALDTIVEALFPKYHKGELGVDFNEVIGDVEKENAPELTEELDAQEATFSENLQKFMKLKDMSQAQLAEKIGIGQPAISMMLKRDCRPQGRTIAKIAEALGVNPSDLWPNV